MAMRRAASPNSYQDRQHLGVAQGGLDAQHHDGPDILKHQDAQGEPAGQGAQLKLLIEQFHHDGGAAQGQAHRQVEQIVLAAQDLDAENPVFKGLADGEPQEHEETEAHGGAQDELENARGNQGFPRFFQLVEVQFQPDHEEKKNQADFRDDLDVCLAAHPAEAELGADGRPRGQVGQKKWLLGQIGQKGQRGGGHDADADSRDETAAPAVTAGPGRNRAQQHGRRQQQERRRPAVEPDSPGWSQNCGYLAWQVKPRDHPFPSDGVSD